MARAVPRKSLTALKFLGAFGAVALTAAGAATIALATTGAYAMALNNSVRISPAMNHVDTLGGRLPPQRPHLRPGRRQLAGRMLPPQLSPAGEACREQGLRVHCGPRSPSLRQLRPRRRPLTPPAASACGSRRSACGRARG